MSVDQVARLTSSSPGAVRGLTHRALVALRSTLDIAEHGSVELATLPFGGALAFVALDRDEADAFLTDQLGDPDDCRPPHARHSHQDELCGFGY